MGCIFRGRNAAPTSHTHLLVRWCYSYNINRDNYDSWSPPSQVELVGAT